MKEKITISGNIILTESGTYVGENTEGQFIQTDSERVGRVTIGDNIIVKTKTKVYDSLIVRNVDLLNKIIYIEDLDKTNVDKKIIIELNSDPVWSIKNPSFNIFGSYQLANAITDSDKIKKYYNNFD